MPGGFNIDVNDLIGLISRMDERAAAIKDNVQNELNASGMELDKLAKEQVPVDTGSLRQSISWFQDETTGPAIDFVAQKEYAPYVEFGTGGMVDVPEGLEDYAMQFKGKGKRQVNLPPRPFMWSAVMAEYPKLIRRIKASLTNE